MQNVAPVSRVDSQLYNLPVGDSSLIVCLHCDLMQRIPELEPGASARCPRCNTELWRRREDSLNRTLALTLAAAVLYFVANSFPMLGLTLVGRDTSTTVIGGAQHLLDNGQKIVGVLVLFTAVSAPANRPDAGDRARQYARARAAMGGSAAAASPDYAHLELIEVMMVGVLVALVKITDYATVTRAAKSRQRSARKPSRSLKQLVRPIYPRRRTNRIL
jgi:paraquat-inducible protein A